MVLRTIGILVSLLLLSCGEKKSSSEIDAAPKQPDADDIKEYVEKEQDADDDETPDFGNSFGMMSLLSQRADEPGPYDAPRESANYKEGAGYVAVAVLKGSVVELQAMSLFGTVGLELHKLGTRLSELAENGQVTGLLLRIDDVQMDFSTAEELRDILLKYRGGLTGRKLWCHVENSTTITTYLLTACDVVGLAPGGSVELSGVAAVPVHIKGLLDKLHVRADFLHIGSYKGAAEPLTLDRPSKEMVETIDAILDGTYAALVSALTETKKLSPDAARALIDQGFFFDQAAVKAGLVTEISTFEKFRDHLGGKPWKNVPLGKDAPDLSHIMEFVGFTPKPRPKVPHVALVYAVGEVVDSSDSGVIGSREQIASRPLSNALRALAVDENVKAIVLRIDSPGGSALASELICQAVKEVVAKKPVIVSMSSLAASGGYYIASNASWIFARQNTLTGSIGVVGGKLVIGDAMKSLGIATYPQKRGAMATTFMPFETWSKAERDRVEQMMLGVYDMFTSHVAAGRKKKKEDVLAVAQGRVWLGSTAKAHGLVDELGGLNAALAHARSLAGISESVPLEIYPSDPTLFDFLKEFTQTRVSLVSTLVETTFLPPEFTPQMSRKLSALLSFGRMPVQTSLWLPVLFR